MRKAGLFNPFLLLLCWSILIGAGTLVLLQTAVRQRLSRNYAVTKGRIVRSELGQSTILRRGVEVEYAYTVNGIKYDGHRFRYDDHNVTFEWVSTVEGLPKGAAHKVYYDPKDPADSLLQPGVDGGDLLLLLFALPLNVLTGTLWHALYGRWRDTRGVRAAGGVRIVKGNGKIRVHLGQTSPLGAGCYAMVAAAFVGAFPAVIFGGFDPPFHLIEAIWVTVLGVGVGAFVWRTMLGLSGAFRLIIDRDSKTMILPQTGGRRKPVSIPLNEITGIFLLRRTTKSPSGTHFSYLPALKRRGSSEETEPPKLITWGWSEEKARAFGEWLAAEIGVRFTGTLEEQGETLVKKDLALAQ
jgi:hypothetical protein